MGPVQSIRSLHEAVVLFLDRTVSSVVLSVGFLTGAALGTVARIWMRFITTNPEFSWEGTLFIVIGFGVMFLGQAVVYLGRRSGVRLSGFVALRILAIITLVPLASAAGAFAFPIIVFAPLAITRRGWNPWLRALFGVFAFLPGVFAASIVFSDLSVVRASIGVVWFALIYGMLVWAAAFSLASRHDSRFTHSVRDSSAYANAPNAQRQ